MKVDAQFTHARVDHSKKNEIHAVVTLQAPKIDWQKDRQPICVVPVLDISTSMGGQKIEYAKQSIMKLIDNLQPGDYCGLAAFGSEVFPIAKPMEMTQARKDDLKAKVGNLHPTGCTNFAGGMRQGLEWLSNADLSNKYIKRVIMFTDGHANQGEAQGRPLIPFMAHLLGDASLSAFGYGSDCDQELLADLAKEGKGNYAFIKNPDDALTAFGRELGGLLSRYAQDIVVDVAPFNGHLITDVLSDVDIDEDGDKVRVNLPEILSEEVRHLVFAVKTSKQSQALPRALNVLDVKITYDRVVDGDKQSITEELKAKVKFVKPGEEQTKPTKEVMEIVGLAQMVQAQIEAEEKAAVGDWAGAQAIMGGYASVMDSFNLHQHATHARGLASKMASSVAYTANAGYLTSNKKGLTRGVENYDKQARVDMNFCCSAPVSTSALDGMEEHFASGTSAEDGVPASSGSINVDLDAGGLTSGNGVWVDPGSDNFGYSVDALSQNIQPSEPEEDGEDEEEKPKKKSKSKSSRW